MYYARSVVSILRQYQAKVNTIQRVVKLQHKQNVYPLRYFSAAVVEDDSDLIVAEICNGDPGLEKKLRILMLEVEVMRQDGRCAPDEMQSNHWKRLLNLNTQGQRNNYLLFLFKTEKSKENAKAKQEARRKEREAGLPVLQKEYPDDLEYGISHQSLFLRIRDQSINNFDNYRACQAMMHGQSIVIDCSYEDHMVWRETVNAAKQMTYVFGDNRLHKDPFNLHLCNVQPKGEFMEQLRRNIPNLEEPWFPLNIHTQSYLDIFPKEKLVYLTPHCRNELTEFDNDAVYIVGCMVDKMSNEALSLAKAKRDGVKMAKLPLDRYLEWAPGAKKNLNINHMIPILLDLNATGDWEYALKHVPRRKLMETKIRAFQNQLKNRSLKRVLKSYSNLPDFRKFMNEKNKRSKKSLYNDDNRI